MSEWIKVNDRLPETYGTMCIVHVKVTERDGSVFQHSWYEPRAATLVKCMDAYGKIFLTWIDLVTKQPINDANTFVTQWMIPEPPEDY
jgi:hypothetical protein